MSPIAHLLASWVIAAKTTDDPRDCRLVTLAGILPDADGFGLLLDRAYEAAGNPNTLFYDQYHHFLLHGAFGGVVISLVFASFARRRGRVALLCLAMFHLHLLCDFVGSRGPAPTDLWPIFYLGPFTREPMWIWKGQWALDAWPNRLISVVLLVWALGLAVRRGDSFVGVFNRRVDLAFVKVLRAWATAWEKKWRPPSS